MPSAGYAPARDGRAVPPTGHGRTPMMSGNGFAPRVECVDARRQVYADVAAIGEPGFRAGRRDSSGLAAANQAVGRMEPVRAPAPQAQTGFPPTSTHALRSCTPTCAGRLPASAPVARQRAGVLCRPATQWDIDVHWLMKRTALVAVTQFGPRCTTRRNYSGRLDAARCSFQVS